MIGKDSAIIKLGITGTIHDIMIDTRHFTGNHADCASVDAIYLPDATVEQLNASSTKVNPSF